MTPATDTRTVRIGFVGAGDWGLGKHLPSIRYIAQPLEFLQAVRDGRPSRSTFASGAESLDLAEQLENMES